MRVKDVYNKNSFSISDDFTVKKAVKVMMEKHFNGVLVTNKNGKLVGVLSMQDIIGGIVPSELQSHVSLAQAMYKSGFFEELCQEIADKKVTEVMRKKFITVQLETSIMEIAADFLHNDLYIVPVVENEELRGVVTRSELKKAFASSMGL
jgi:predicted transcriptional regulator